MESRNEFVGRVWSELNDDQRVVFDVCINTTDNVFCTGQGGTGKSRLLEYIVMYFTRYSNRRNVAVTASTGIAAFNIGGMTLHRFAGVGIEVGDIESMVQKARRGQSFSYWISSDILVIDEISMVSPDFFDAISDVGKKIRGNELPFGGIRVLMFGDFLQLPPVSRGADLGRRVFHTDAWEELDPQIFHLSSIMRQTDSTFRDVLAGIRYGICTPAAEDYILELGRHVRHDDGIEPVFLFAKRDSTTSFNEERLSRLPGDITTIKSVDKGNMSVLSQCPSPEYLKLKVGAQVMLTRNITDRAVNGSIGVVTAFNESPSTSFLHPVVTFVSIDGGLFEMTVGEAVWESKTPSGTVISSRRQIPLILAWGITIHRSQGATIPRLCVDMSGIFEVGQAYVALSRCPDPDNLTVLNFDRNCVMASRSCVEFYNNNRPLISVPDPPEYNVESPPSYDDVVATNVAGTTRSQWETTRAQLPNQLRETSQSADHLIMMSRLNLESPHTISEFSSIE